MICHAPFLLAGYLDDIMPSDIVVVPPLLLLLGAQPHVLRQALLLLLLLLLLLRGAGQQGEGGQAAQPGEAAVQEVLGGVSHDSHTDYSPQGMDDESLS